ncbi:MAG: FAD-dependent oxidoreductase [Acidimicrobiales bacterium]|nr:FAD-dependent oxidoreductase [Acidimicrobiales bacterium]
MAERYSLLRAPITIGDCTIPNRIVRTAHATGFAFGLVSDRLIAYHEARARGGVGLNFLEIASVHQTSPGSLMAWDDMVIEGLTTITDRIHAHGSKVFQQLWHGGANAKPFDGTPSWAPSEVPEPTYNTMPQAMTKAMIDEVVDGFGSAAKRCQTAGMDGVEIHGAHGYLVGQFLSPKTNLRTDDYGGSLDNRVRFAAEALASIRAAVGPGFPVGIRLSGTEGIPDGIQPHEAAATAAMLEAQGLVDFVNVSMGSYYAFSKFIGAMHEPLGYELPTSRVVTAAVRVPRIVTGRIMDLHDAERVIADGIADLVSMVRATIADPEIVAKSFAGEADRVRPCLSCNQGCVGGIFGPAASLGCVVNPDAGHEHLGIDPYPAAPKTRNVVVVGGGPAGLEAASTAARRGHSVVLCDAADELGGQLRWARRAPHRQDIAASTDWLVEECRRLGVTLHTGTLVDLAYLEGLEVDAVILATGAELRRDGVQAQRPDAEVPGVSLPHVATTIDVLGGWTKPAERAVVFDDRGDIGAVSVTEHLLAQGMEVVLVTSRAEIAAELGPSLQREPAQQRLRSHPRFQERVAQALVSVSDSSVTIEGLDDARSEILPADLVVLDTGAEPRRDLLAELEAAGYEVHLAGDALAAEDLQHAMASAREVARSV